MPLLLGGDVAFEPTETSSGFVIGARPELIFAWTKSDEKTTTYGFGFGPYIEAMGSTGTSQIWLGGGATAVFYRRWFGVALSGGLDCDWLHANPNASPVISLFAGLRPTSLAGVDFPVGLRVDFRPPVGDVPATMIFALQLDFAGLAVGFFAALTHGLNN